MSKLIQCIRFIAMPYPSNLIDAFQTWGTGIFDFSLPDSITNQLFAYDINMVFVEYGVTATFMGNFWDSMLLMVIAMVCWILCRLLLLCLEPPSFIWRMVNCIRSGCINFLVVQLYSGFGDIIFFTVLEMQSLQLTSAWSGISFGVSVLFVVLSVGLIAVHCIFLVKHYRLKSTRTSGVH